MSGYNSGFYMAPVTGYTAYIGPTSNYHEEPATGYTTYRGSDGYFYATPIREFDSMVSQGQDIPDRLPAKDRK